MKIFINFLFSIFFICLFFYIISCNDKPTESQTGIISVSVIDNGTGTPPVPDVEITITPGDIIKKTDEDGSCRFEVEPGNYFVNANVCCVGPGFIGYHVPVTVIKNDTIKVKLDACLLCL